MHLSKGATENEERQEFNTRTHDYVPQSIADDEYSRYDVKVLEESYMILGLKMQELIKQESLIYGKI